MLQKKKLHFKKGSTFALNQKDNKNSLDLFNWLYKELTFLGVTIPTTTCCTGHLYLKADVFKKKKFKESGFSMRKWLIKQLNQYDITFSNTNPCCPETNDIKVYTGFITYSPDKGKSMENWLRHSLDQLNITIVTDTCC